MNTKICFSSTSYQIGSWYQNTPQQLVLQIDLWQNHQSGFSQHRMHLCKHLLPENKQYVSVSRSCGLITRRMHRFYRIIHINKYPPSYDQSQTDCWTVKKLREHWRVPRSKRSAKRVPEYGTTWLRRSYGSI